MGKWLLLAMRIMYKVEKILLFFIILLFILLILVTKNVYFF